MIRLESLVQRSGSMGKVQVYSNGRFSSAKPHMFVLPIKGAVAKFLRALHIKSWIGAFVVLRPRHGIFEAMCTPKDVNYAGAQLSVASSTWVLKLGWFESTRLTAQAGAFVGPQI